MVEMTMHWSIDDRVMLVECIYRGFDPRQPEQSTPADVDRSFLLIVDFLPCQMTILVVQSSLVHTM